MAEHSILVVEDEQTLRRLLEYRLSKQYRVRTASHGEEALDRISEEVPDLIISDIMMPRMDGFALQAALQNSRVTRAIPFIFLTAKADEQSKIRGLNTGVDDYITKPFDIDQLLIRINKLLERTSLYQTQLNARIGQDFSQKLMPKKMPHVPGYRSYFFTDPREEGGGDLFDWVETADGSYLFTIGDVMGKGVQAKFYAFSFLGYIKGIVHAMQQTTSPAAVLRRLNEMLMRDEVLGETFVSLLLIRWHPLRNQIVYANAGHCRPLLVHDNRADVLEYSDLILGLDGQAEFQDTTIDLAPGDAIVAYTDALIEQPGRNGEAFGEAGVMDAALVSCRAPQPVPAMLNHLLLQSREPAFVDDVLVFWLQREG